MKILNSENTRERIWYLVKEFTTKNGKKARIQKCVWNDEVKKLAPSLHDFYTGYVQVENSDEKKEREVEVHGGVTFSGELPETEGYWVGFDMNHYGDENLQSEEYAEEQCEKLSTYY